MGTRLLHQAKKLSRQLILVLSLVGALIIGLITLGQPWVHFQVPLTLPGGPADPPPQTIPINTIFIVRCSDVSCLHEQDHNACKTCPRRPIPGARFSSVLRTPFCLPQDDPTAPGVSPLLCNGPHYLRTSLPSPGWGSLLQDHPRCHVGRPHLPDPDPGVPGSLPSLDLLDSAWAFFFISGFTSFCLCLILIDITFFTKSNVPVLDFSNIVLSNLAGMALRSFL